MNRSSFKKWFITIATILLIAVFETSAGGVLMVNSVVPDLLFAFTVASACTRKDWSGALNIALMCGIFSDFVCHSVFLGYTAIYSLSAVATYFLKNLLLKPNVFFIDALALVVFIAGKALLSPVVYFTRGIAFSNFFLNDVLPSAVYNTVCFFVMYLILNAIAKRGGKHHATEV